MNKSRRMNPGQDGTALEPPLPQPDEEDSMRMEEDADDTPTNPPEMRVCDFIFVRVHRSSL